MHELSIVEALLDRVAAEAARHRATAVSRLRLRIGELSGVEPDLLATAFAMARQTSTLCAAAELEIVPEAVEWSCPRCERAIERGAILACPTCGSPARLSGGGEILLERIEMEVPDV